jgi:thiol-disulfide isomerase/thioredoxin
LIAGTSCKNKHAYFEIKGKIVNAKGTKLSLKQLVIGNQNPVLLDTASISKDGSLDLKTVMPVDQALFVLSTEKGPDVYLINDVPNITLNLDIDHYKQYTVEGSPSSKELHRFLDAYSAHYQTTIEKVSAYDSIQKTEASDSVVQIYKDEKDAALKTVNQLLTVTIQQSINPALKSYLLAKAFATMDKESIGKLLTATKEQYKNYTPINFLDNIIKQQLKETPAPYALLNKQAPSFSMTDNYNRPFFLDSLKGKYVLLDFWASWSKPCREENQNVEKAYRLYKKRDFTIISVSLDSNMHEWKQALDDDNLYWQNVADFKEWKSPVVNQYKITALPFNVLLDNTGKIIAADLRGRDLTMKLNEVLPKVTSY